MPGLHIDFETASRCDLKKAGLARYAEDPSTRVHCMAFAFGDEEVRLWDTATNWVTLLHPVFDHVRSGGIVYAHNASFELAIWNKVMVPQGWPPLRTEQVRCTMAMCYAMALPGSLEAAAPALGIDQRKDAVGKRVMLQLCKPDKDDKFLTFAAHTDKFKILYEYCKQDVETERALHKRLKELSDSEQELWVLDQKINENGISLDAPSVDRALELVAGEKKRLDAAMLKVTGGVVGACTEVQMLVKWIRSEGVSLPGLAKADVLDALDGELPPKVRQAVELRKEAAKSSTAKLRAMRERMCEDGRIRGVHQYHGAATGRWAGRGVQLQNMPRPRYGVKPQDIEDAIRLFRKRDELDMFHGPVLDAVSDCLRALLVAPHGFEFVAVDFSAVEARVLAWLAGEESVLAIFRTHGKIYEHAAAAIYHVPMDKVTKDQRQIGKVAVLALGFGGGKGAFQAMARGYQVVVSDDEAEEIKTAWREANPHIVQYWYDIEAAAIRALCSGSAEKAGKPGREVTFKKAGSFLWCRLPSGRVLCYPYPEVRTVTTPWGAEKEALTYMTQVSNVKAKILDDPNSSGTWKRISTYGGSLAENVTQAVARDLLAHGMKALDRARYRIAFHVHDEAVVEINATAPEDTAKKVEALMTQLPEWATNLPLTAEGWRARRYRK